MSGPRRGRPDARHARLGREVAVQMLYQQEVGGSDIDTVVQTYWQIEPPEGADDAVRAFAEGLARGTVAHLDVIDALIAEQVEHWRPSRLAVLDRLILRLAAYELLHTDAPPAVVINEAIELSKRFSTEGSGAFVNGVLDALRRRLEAGAVGAVGG